MYKENLYFNYKEVKNKQLKGRQSTYRHFTKIDIKMANKFLKRSWTSLIIIKIQIKIIMKHL